MPGECLADLEDLGYRQRRRREAARPTVLLEVVDMVPETDHKVAITVAEAEAALPPALSDELDVTDVAAEVRVQERARVVRAR